LPDPAGEEPIYLVLEDALELYAAIIDASPVQAAHHLRNRSGLEAGEEGVRGSSPREGFTNPLLTSFLVVC
jgi:hypothetical protein